MKEYARVQARIRGGAEQMFWVRAISAGTLRTSKFYVIVDNRGEFDDSPVCLDYSEVVKLHPAELNKDGELQAVI